MRPQIVWEMHQDGDAELYAPLHQHEMLEDWNARLLAEIPWEQQHLRIQGKLIPFPRLVSWHGDREAVYSYSGNTNQPKPWNNVLLSIKEIVEETAGVTFNSVLLNLYSDERSSVGWHADDEPELGRKPTIASVSLGQPRVFQLKHNRSKDVVDIVLPHGSLLLMKGELQEKWKHSIPKGVTPMGRRINLTFRRTNADG